MDEYNFDSHEVVVEKSSENGTSESVTEAATSAATAATGYQHHNRKTQKALKRTQKHGEVKHRARRSAAGSTASAAGQATAAAATADDNEEDADDEDEDPTVCKTYMLSGNVQFTCSRDQFKCVECDHSDLKSHYKRDYICHQCFYNTGCSRSFEHHLHGHLAKKRVAMWSKNFKMAHVEEYSCPCGYLVSSSVGGIGNKVAEHLNSCEYKYCFYRTVSNGMFVEEESPKIDYNKPQQQQQATSYQHDTSDGIIIMDSSDEI